MSADDDRAVARKLVDELFSDRTGVRMPARAGRVLDRDRRRRRAALAQVDDVLDELRSRGTIPPDDPPAA